MKAFYYAFLVLLFITYNLFGQTVLNEDFGSGTMPPTGWNIDAHSSNWSAENSNNARGSAPEARFSWSPQFNGQSHLISPSLDMTGIDTVLISFKHSIDHYGGSYTVGLATRSGGGSWNSVWEKVNPSSSITEKILIGITNSDLNNSDFQVSWYFSGNSYNINYWYIDDIELSIPYDHDVLTKTIPIDNQVTAGNPITPSALVQNIGLQTETFDVFCKLYNNATLVYSDSQNVASLDFIQEQSVNFASFTPLLPDDIYKIEMYTKLPGDANTSNDTLSKYINTYTTARDMVVLEIGTGTWCQYCPGAAMGADELVHQGNNVAVVENHNGDPYTNTYSDARNNYYGITGYPTAVFGGVDNFVGGSNTTSMYSNYLPLYTARNAIKSAFSLNISGETLANDFNSYNVVVTVNKIARLMPEWTNNVLQLALTESHIAQSWQGQDSLQFVNRLMIPDVNGTALDFNSGDTLNIHLSFNLDTTWVASNCELVAFVQNNDTKEILQGTKVSLSLLQPTSVGNEAANVERIFYLSQNYPNPFNPDTYISYSLPKKSAVSLNIYNNLGQKIRTLLNNVSQPAENYKVYWNGKDDFGKSVSSGIYYYSIISKSNNKVYEKSRKMLLIK